MLVEDSISTAPIIDQIPQHFLPNSYGLAPQPPAVDNTMDLGPPPVTRLVPDNLAAAARLPTNSVSRIEAIKNLLCSESDSEFSALSGDNPKLATNSSLDPPSIPAARIPAQASFAAIPHPIPRLSSGAANLSTSLGDYRSSHHPFHIPLMIKIPTKVRLPPQKDGKRINQHTYKPHAPGDGLLKIDKTLDTTASVPGAPLVSTDRLYQSIVMTDHGILNIISSNEPGSKVPTPPPSYLSVYSNSTGTSSSSVAPSLASTSSPDDQTQAAMAMTSLSLTQSTSVNNCVKPKRSRSRAGGLGKKRTSFTRNQVYGMERRFDQQRYLTSVERKEFSNSIGLDDHHVKIWFQNRRSKLKKQAVVSSSGGPVRPTTNIRAKPPPGTNPLPPQHFISHAIKSEDTSSSATSSVSCHQAVPAQLHPTHPIPATDYHHNMNGSIPSCMGAPLMAPQASSGVSYQSMNSTTASVPISYSSSTIPTGMNAFVASTQGVPAATAPGSFAHPYAHQYHDSNANVMMSSATHSHIPTMTTQASAMHGMSTMSGVPFQPPYGYVYDYGVEQGTTFAAQGSRSSSPFGNFPFSPGFNCLPDDAGLNSFHQMPIVPPVNMM